jgi:hypothetical protein
MLALTKTSPSTDLSQFHLPAGRLIIIGAAAITATVLLTAVPARIARRSPALEANADPEQPAGRNHVSAPSSGSG